MRTPLPKIEDVRKASKDKLDQEIESEREEVIAAILGSKHFQCQIDKQIYQAIQRELASEGYNVVTVITGRGIHTTIQW